MVTTWKLTVPTMVVVFSSNLGSNIGRFRFAGFQTFSRFFHGTPREISGHFSGRSAPKPGRFGTSRAKPARFTVSRDGISPRPEFRVYFRPTCVARDSVSADRETGLFGPQDAKTPWFGAGRAVKRPEIPHGLSSKKPKFPRKPLIAERRTKSCSGLGPGTSAENLGWKGPRQCSRASRN